jgi:hypothetical protein
MILLRHETWQYIFAARFSRFPQSNGADSHVAETSHGISAFPLRSSWRHCAHGFPSWSAGGW